MYVEATVSQKQTLTAVFNNRVFPENTGTVGRILSYQETHYRVLEFKNTEACYQDENYIIWYDIQILTENAG